MSLSLNWKLQSPEERSTFVSKLLESYTPTDAELETLSRYILYASPKDGSIYLPTSSGDWSPEASQKLQSLDELLESPVFSESNLRRPSDPILRTPHYKFSRAEARKNASPEALRALESIWYEIDSTEFLCNLWEINHNKRSVPPREALYTRLGSDVDALIARADSLSEFQYLRLRHLLIELRRQQYTLQDSYKPRIQNHQSNNGFFDFSTEWEFGPVYIAPDSSLGRLVFRSDRFPEPNDFDESALTSLSSALWKTPARLTLDFASSTTLYALNQSRPQLEESIARNQSIESTELLRSILRIFRTYVDLSNLKPIHLRILDLKSEGLSNDLVRDRLKAEFGTTYTINYLSTVYHHSILDTIAQTARRHREVLENIFFPENFKQCLDCGRVLLRDSQNFVRRSRVKDGFSCRCKACEKILRDRRNSK